MLIKSGRIGQECASSALLNHSLGFVGRGKILSQFLYSGMEARLRKNNGQLVNPSNQAVDADGTYLDQKGTVRKAILNRLRFGRDGALIEAARTNDVQSDGSTYGMPNNSGGTFARTVDTSEVTDPLGGNTATKWECDFSAISSGQYMFAESPGGSYEVTSYWLRGAVGGEQLYIWHAPAPAPVLVNLTTSWQKFTMITAAKSRTAFVQDRRTAAMDTNLSDAIFYSWAITATNEGNIETSCIVNPDGSGVLRAADDFRYANAGEAICKAAQGTAIVAVTSEFNAADITGQARIFDIRPADNADGWTLLADDGTNSYKFKVRTGGATIADIDSSIIVPVKGRTDIIAVSWKLNEYTLYANGAQEGQDIAGAVPTAMNTSLYVGQNNANIQQWLGNIDRSIFTDSVLSSRQVENATAVLRKAA